MITFAQLSETGGRKVNEDSVGFVDVGPEIRMFALADGLGGHGRGEDASSLIVREAEETFLLNYQKENCLHLCFEEGQRALLQKQEEENAKEDLKSTMVLLTICNAKIQWGHVGDSRLYYFEDRHLVKRTMDHSVPQMLVNAGELKEREIRHHPDRNRLLRVMGMEWEVPQYQISPPLFMHTGEESRQFLLCSDGFWEYITEIQMESCLQKAETVQDWLKKMEKIVLVSGKGANMDNFSAIAVWMFEDDERGEKKWAELFNATVGTTTMPKNLRPVRTVWRGRKNLIGSRRRSSGKVWMPSQQP
ncbi:MAG: protein phosphatase 2C domain-containing protein [Eubacteriales bacterium]|nr:protein phosphatase 2C domain-containing protein [Eubacteriales bacterium]